MRAPRLKWIEGGAAVAVATALALAMPGSAGAGEDGSWNAERAFVEMERLQAEIGMLRALAGAQAALLAWNRARSESGAAPVLLSQALCVEEGLAPWCRALPATFGADAARAADERHGKEGE